MPRPCPAPRLCEVNGQELVQHHFPSACPTPTATCSPRHTSHQNTKMMDYCWAPCLGSSPVLLRETRSKSPLYPPVPEMLLPQPLLLLEHSVWQTEDQPEEPASQLTWWGGSRKRREVEVQKGGVWPYLLERTGLLGQDSLKSQSSSLLSGPPHDGTVRKLEETETSGNLPGDPPQALFLHPWGSRTPAQRAKGPGRVSEPVFNLPSCRNQEPYVPQFPTRGTSRADMGSNAAHCRLRPSREDGETKVQQEQTWREPSPKLRRQSGGGGRKGDEAHAGSSLHRKGGSEGHIKRPLRAFKGAPATPQG